MRQTWEVFFEAVERRSVGFDRAHGGGSGGEYRRLALAISEAGLETVSHLRYTQGWSLHNTQMLVGRMVDAASEWLTPEARSPEDLERRLREVCLGSQDLSIAEEEWRRATERVIADAPNHSATSINAA